MCVCPFIVCMYCFAWPCAISVPMKCVCVVAFIDPFACTTACCRRLTARCVCARVSVCAQIAVVFSPRLLPLICMRLSVVCRSVH